MRQILTVSFVFLLNGTLWAAEQSGPSEEYYMEAGRIYVVQNDSAVQLTAEISLGNGSLLKPDGTFISREGTRARLKEGQSITQAGMLAQHQMHNQTSDATPHTLRSLAESKETREQLLQAQELTRQRHDPRPPPAQEQHPFAESRETQEQIRQAQELARQKRDVRQPPAQEQHQLAESPETQEQIRQAQELSRQRRNVRQPPAQQQHQPAESPETQEQIREAQEQSRQK